MAVLSTLKHHGSYDRTCLIYDNLCLYITANLIYFLHLVSPAYPTVFKTAWRGIRCSSVLKSSAYKFFDEKMNQIVYSV